MTKIFHLSLIVFMVATLVNGLMYNFVANNQNRLIGELIVRVGCLEQSKKMIYLGNDLRACTELNGNN
jgi:cytochrome b561